MNSLVGLRPDDGTRESVRDDAGNRPLGHARPDGEDGFGRGPRPRRARHAGLFRPDVGASAGRVPSGSYAANLDARGLTEARIGYFSNFVDFDAMGETAYSETQVLARSAIADLERLTERQALVPIDITSPRYGRVLDALYAALDAQARPGATKARELWDAYLPGLDGTPISTLGQLIKMVAACSSPPPLPSLR